MSKVLPRIVVVSVTVVLCFSDLILGTATCLAQSSVTSLHAELLNQRSATRHNAPNSAGWSTGYSVVTSTREKSRPLGAFGQSDRYLESTSKLVPNDPLGQPIRGAINRQQNSHGWFTGYSAVTSTYTRPSTLFDPIGSGETVTESVTQVVPNGPLGEPIRPLGW